MAMRQIVRKQGFYSVVGWCPFLSRWANTPWTSDYYCAVTEKKV